MRRVRTPVSIHLDLEGNTEWQERIELSCPGFADRLLAIRIRHRQCVRRDSNPRDLIGSQACCLNTSNATVESRGLEPRSLACKASAFPVQPRPRSPAGTNRTFVSRLSAECRAPLDDNRKRGLTDRTRTDFYQIHILVPRPLRARPAWVSRTGVEPVPLGLQPSALPS